MTHLTVGSSSPWAGSSSTSASSEAGSEKSAQAMNGNSVSHRDDVKRPPWNDHNAMHLIQEDLRAGSQSGTTGRGQSPTCPAGVLRLDASVVVLIAVQQRVPPPHRRQAQPAEELPSLEGIDQVLCVPTNG